MDSAVDGVLPVKLDRLLSSEGLRLAHTFVADFFRLCFDPPALITFLVEHPPALIALGGAAALGLYMVIARLLLHGRPRRGSAVESERPPPLSPAAARYVCRRGFDDRTYVAALLGLAAKGHLEIDGAEGTFVLRRTAGGESSMPDEAELLAALFRGGPELPLSGRGREAARAGEQALRKALAADHDGESFARNRRLIVPGVLLFLGTLVAMTLAAPRGGVPIAAFMFLWLTIWTAGVFGLLTSVVGAFRGIFTSRGTFRRIASVLGAAFMVAFSLPFLAGELLGIGLLAFAVTPFGVFGYLVSLALVVRLPGALVVATERGGALMEAIEDHRAFLSAPESWHPVLTRDGPAEAFARHLPYAFALDVTEPWAARFGGSLGAFLGPPWLLGTRGERLDTAALCALLNGPFALAVTMAVRRRAS